MSESKEAKNNLSQNEIDCITAVVQIPLTELVIMHTLTEKLLETNNLVCLTQVNEIKIMVDDDRPKFIYIMNTEEHDVMMNNLRQLVYNYDQKKLITTLLPFFKFVPAYKDIYGPEITDEILNWIEIGDAEALSKIEFVFLYLYKLYFDSSLFMVNFGHLTHYIHNCGNKISYCLLTLINENYPSWHGTALIFQGGAVEFFDPNGSTPGFEQSKIEPLLERAFHGMPIYSINDAYPVKIGAINVGPQSATILNSNNNRFDNEICGLYSVFYIYQRVLNNTTPAKKIYFDVTCKLHTKHGGIESLFKFVRKVLLACKTSSGDLFNDICELKKSEMSKILKNYIDQKKINSINSLEFIKILNMDYEIEL